MGSMFKTPKAPTPLDVGKVTSDASAQNLKTAQQNAAMNRVDQTDAAGNTIQWRQTGVDASGAPTYGVTQTLGDMGRMFQGGFADMGRRYMSAAGSGMPDSSGALDRAYEFASGNLEPRFARSTAAAEARLRNQGLDPTSEAYKSAMNDLSLQQNEARNDLTTKLQGQMFNQGLQSRQQMFGELAPGMSYGASTMTPGSVSTPGVSVGGVDVAGLARGAKDDEFKAYQAAMAQQGSMLGGLASLGGSLLMAPMTGGGSLMGGLMGGLGSLAGFGGGGAPTGGVKNISGMPMQMRAY